MDLQLWRGGVGIGEDSRFSASWGVVCGFTFSGKRSRLWGLMVENSLKLILTILRNTSSIWGRITEKKKVKQDGSVVFIYLHVQEMSFEECNTSSSMAEIEATSYVHRHSKRYDEVSEKNISQARTNVRL